MSSIWIPYLGHIHPGWDSQCSHLEALHCVYDIEANKKTFVNKLEPSDNLSK